jgi:hypothetical protein
MAPFFALGGGAAAGAGGPGGMGGAKKQEKISQSSGSKGGGGASKVRKPVRSIPVTLAAATGTAGVAFVAVVGGGAVTS